MMFVQKALTADWPTVRAAVEEKQPSLGVLATAAFLSRDPEVRQGLLQLLAGAEHEGLLPVHRMALVGDAAGIAEMDADQLDAAVQVPELANNSALGRWTAAHIAAGAGHADVLAALRDRGADLESIVGNGRERPLDVAVRLHRPSTVVWLLEAGIRPGPRTVSNLSPGVPDTVLDPLLAAGMDLNVWADGYDFPALLMHRQEPLREKLALVRRLHARGLRLDARLVYELASPLERYDAEDIPAVLEALLELDDIDLDEPIVTGYPEPAERPLIERALRDWPIDVVRRLVEAGAHVPTLRVAGTWPDADRKRALLDELGRTPGEPDLAEFITLADDDITVARIVRLIAGPGMAIAGVTLGTPEPDVLEMGLEDMREHGHLRGETAHDPRGTDRDLRRPSRARHELIVWLDEGQASKAAYHVYFAEREDARGVFDALKQACTEAVGKPRGRKDLSWRADGTQLQLTTRREPPSWHVVSMVLE